MTEETIKNPVAEIVEEALDENDPDFYDRAGARLAQVLNEHPRKVIILDFDEDGNIIIDENSHPKLKEWPEEE